MGTVRVLHHENAFFENGVLFLAWKKMWIKDNFVLGIVRALSDDSKYVVR